MNLCFDLGITITVANMDLNTIYETSTSDRFIVLSTTADHLIEIMIGDNLTVMIGDHLIVAITADLNLLMKKNK